MAFTLKPDWATFPKHYSTWLGVVVIALDTAYVFVDQLGAMLAPQTVILLNAVLLPAGMKVLQLLKQDIPVAPEVKAEMKETLRELPTTKPETITAASVREAMRPPQVLTQGQFNDLVDARISKAKQRKPRGSKA